jgi:hypothetical protein
LNATYHYVNPFPLITQIVEVIFTAVAMPRAARVLVPVVVVPARYIVSVVIAIDVETEAADINVIVVPTGNATDPFAGIVIVCPVTVTYMCLPASAATRV